MQCKACHGKGLVTLYQKERQCTNCKGVGKLTEEAIIEVIASVVDVKSVYHHGPSSTAIRTAKSILAELKNRFDLSEIEREDA